MTENNFSKSWKYKICLFLVSYSKTFLVGDSGSLLDLFVVFFDMNQTFFEILILKKVSFLSHKSRQVDTYMIKKCTPLLEVNF